jgi:hypothetical protein
LFLTGIVISEWIIEEVFTLIMAYGLGLAGFVVSAMAMVFGAIGSFKNRTSNPAKRIIQYSIGIAAVILVISCVYLTQYPALYQRKMCEADMRNITRALHFYAKVNHHYPSAQIWCDELLDFTGKDTYRYPQDFRKNFNCPGSKTEKSSYAVNSHATPESSPDTVLLFECNDGWNVSGGPELVTFENHQGKGCNVVFVNLEIKFVDKKDFKELKW